jgi:hypothetical protein
MPVKKAEPKAAPIPEPEAPKEELTEEKLAAETKAEEVVEKNQTNFMEDLNKSEPLQQFKEDSLVTGQEKHVNESSSTNFHAPAKKTETELPTIELADPGVIPVENVTAPKEVQIIQTPTTPPSSNLNDSRPNNENFIDELYKLSRAKSSPIPKLLLLIALVLGLGVGAYYYYQSTLTNNSLLGFLGKPESTYTPITKENLSLNLEITNPDDEMLVYDKTIIVSGKTNANARLVVNNGKTYTALQANDQGEFSKVVDLNLGTNQIVIYAFDEQGNTKTETRTIYYSEEKI